MNYALNRGGVDINIPKGTKYSINFSVMNGKG